MYLSLSVAKFYFLINNIMLYLFPAYNINIEADSIEEATEKLHNQLGNVWKSKESPNDTDIVRKSKKVSRDN